MSPPNAAPRPLVIIVSQNKILYNLPNMVVVCY
jgi:hypothetical protein